MGLEEELMLNGEWAALDELNKEKVRQANQGLIDEEAGGYGSTSNNTECANCNSPRVNGMNYCPECYTEETSQNCSNCGDTLTRAEAAAIINQENDYCFECE